MLTLSAGQAESLWDEALPVEVRELPDDLAAVGRLLSDPALLAPIVAHWQREVLETRRAVLTDGRPTIAMETCQVDGAQAALPLGVSDAGERGVGLDSSASVLPDLAVRAGAGRVDGEKAHQTDWWGDSRRADSRADLQGDAGE